MHWLWLLRTFDPRGRAGRSRFWLGLISLYGILFAGAVAALAFGKRIAIDGVLFAVSVEGNRASFSGAPFLLLVAPIAVRRLHDRNRSAWWLVPFFVLPPCLLWLADAIDPLADDAAAALPATLEAALSFVSAGLQITLSAAGLVLSVWCLVEVGFMRGTRGSNRFGTDPGAIRRVPSSSGL